MIVKMGNTSTFAAVLCLAAVLVFGTVEGGIEQSVRCTAGPCKGKVLTCPYFCYTAPGHGSFSGGPGGGGGGSGSGAPGAPGRGPFGGRGGRGGGFGGGGGGGGFDDGFNSQKDSILRRNPCHFDCAHCVVSCVF
ncbi:hypothetical protein KP509_18G084500 [Ceratopteris richardii]|uniref:Uncharacterized protein n=1 Tax=Ceratopteris richardii TaxID=49495 RepID=A0A8T2SRE7_CERRI|nr:hypothetical protein KP509_18G084500 [Ceratopteris richardii]